MPKTLSAAQRQLLKTYLRILLAQVEADKKAAAKGRIN
jgi:hypothetical protein